MVNLDVGVSGEVFDRLAAVTKKASVDEKYLPELAYAPAESHHIHLKFSS